jgi:hypothetical protein
LESQSLCHERSEISRSRRYITAIHLTKHHGCRLDRIVRRPCIGPQIFIHSGRYCTSENQSVIHLWPISTPKTVAVPYSR